MCYEQKSLIIKFDLPHRPLKAQVAIRDHWTKSDGPLQTTLKSLQDLLGHEIALDPEWQILLAELDEFYPDKANFVQTIAGCVQTWAKSLTELLEDDSPGNEEWIETVLEKSKFGRLRIYLEVSSSSSEKGGTSWSEQRNGFIITIPKKRIFVPTELFPVFRGALLTCFETPKSKPLPLPLRQGAGGAAADEWADVKLDTTTGKPEVVEKQQTGGGAHGSLSRTAAVQFLPNVQSLPRPDELFLRPPYFLTVLPSHGGEIEIQGSHSPSLKFLADYLERWCRVNHHDTTAVSNCYAVDRN